MDDTTALACSLIESAFAETQYPGDDNLGYSAQNWDGIAVTRWLKGKKWQELDVSTYQTTHAEIPYLTVEAHRYYLPAFMIAVLKGTSGNISADILMGLSPKYYVGRSFRAFAEGCTEEQKRAIQRFLQVLADEYDNRTTEIIETDSDARVVAYCKKIQNDPEGNPARCALRDYWDQVVS